MCFVFCDVIVQTYFLFYVRLGEIIYGMMVRQKVGAMVAFFDSIILSNASCLL
jgi:hypothetical protein